MKYTTLLVDDENHSRELLKNYLEKYCPELKVVDMAKNVAEAYEKIICLKPQIVFLDIALLDDNAFDLLIKFEEMNFEIIFVTAYHDHAVRAFRFSAVDYLLKPINIELLVNAVRKACRRIEEKTTVNNLKVLTGNIKLREQINKIALPTLEGFIFIDTAQIIRCQASGSYTEFFFNNRKPMLVSRVLKDFEELLKDQNFLRVHHSHLINLNHVAEYHKGKLSYIIMADKSTVEVSVRKREKFLKKLSSLKI